MKTGPGHINPLENLGLVADPGKNFVAIMKDGKIYNNTGIASSDLSTIKSTKKTRKVYPLDADAVYPEVGS